MRTREDITGNKYGRYTVIQYDRAGSHDNYWICRCECGTVKSVSGNALKSGHTKSCGCLLHEQKTNYKHGCHGTRLYRTWYSMRNRCKCKTNTSYPRYGGRGITYCGEWDDFMTFREWAISSGYDDSLTLDRIDVNGNYEPENCRWIPTKEQNINRRNTIYAEYKGERKPLFTWCQELKLPYRSMWFRIVKYGWDVERAFSTPIRGQNVN